MLMRVAVFLLVSSPIMLALWGERDMLVASLRGMSFDATFFLAAAIAGYLVFSTLMLLVFLLEALPGAPLRHIEIDADGVTSRRWFFVRRVLHRDIDGWSVAEHELRTTNAHWPQIIWHAYSVVAGNGVAGLRRVNPEQRYSMSVRALAYTPLGAGHGNFADLLSMFLSDCRRARGRNAFVDAPEPLGSQVFSLAPRRADAHMGKAKASQQKARAQSHASAPAQHQASRGRMPGRFPTNEDKAAYWSSQATQALRADDNHPAFEHLAQNAYLYEQLARRDRKRLARERREARLAQKAKQAEKPSQPA